MTTWSAYHGNKEKHRKASKFLSYILRHKPDSIGLTLDANGWANVAELITKANRFDKTVLEEIVESDSKGRYEFSEDGSRIRAVQGHSIDVVSGWEEATPPKFLFHGTSTKHIESIERGGLLRMSRQHVHLHDNWHTARLVGARHGKPVVVLVKALDMHSFGHAFYKAKNDVWLTEHVPTEFLRTKYDDSMAKMFGSM